MPICELPAIKSKEEEKKEVLMDASEKSYCPDEMELTEKHEDMWVHVAWVRVHIIYNVSFIVVFSFVPDSFYKIAHIPDRTARNWFQNKSSSLRANVSDFPWFVCSVLVSSLKIAHQHIKLSGDAFIFKTGGYGTEFKIRAFESNFLM